MKESVAIAKEASRKKESSPTRSDNSIQRFQNEPERQLGSLRAVIGNIRRNGDTPSVENIATELSVMPSSDRTSALLALQQTHGNQYVQCVVTGIQAKLKVGQPGDKYEQEADRVAEQVMQMLEQEVQRQAEEEEKKKEEEKLIQTKPLSEQITPLVQRQAEEKEEEEEEILQTKENPGQTPEVTPDFESRIQSLKSSGQSLPEADRGFMERRFGIDFSGVRLHTDSDAAQMSRELNAEAFTYGRDIYFGAGKYSPGTSSGKRLLAHELTHVVQQRPAIQRNPDSPYTREQLRAFYRFIDNPWLQDTLNRIHVFSIYEKTGGDMSLNELVNWLNETEGFTGQRGRAIKYHELTSQDGRLMERYYPSLRQAGLTPLYASGRFYFLLHNRTYYWTIRDHARYYERLLIPAQATSFAQYVDLIQRAERAFSSYTPRQMLSLLRQLYYGAESWSRTRSRFWRDVIPCGLSIPDPRPTLGGLLFNALHNSQVVAGTDIGHVFTGLESMLCPTSTVELEIFGPNPVVNMPNEEFATWGGDLGSAAAHKVHDELDRRIRQNWSHYFGNSGTPASYEDLRGDIDSYVIRKGLTGTACEATPRTRIPTISAPISQILHQYYTAAETPIGGARANRFLCFVRAIGGRVSEGRITNKSSLIHPIRNRVKSFAETFYLGLVTVPLFAIGVREAQRLFQYSWEVTERFLNWLERRLS